MNPLLRLALFVLFAVGSALPSLAEGPKFGTVDVAKAFEAYHLTVTERTRVREAVAKLSRDPRNDVIKLLQVEIADLKDEARNPTLSEAQRTEYFRKHMMKTFERDSLQRQRDEFVAEERKKLDRTMVTNLRKLLDDVRAVVETIAKEDGLDYVFETGGKTSSQIAPLIYIRDAEDLTDRVIAALNKNKKAKDEVASTAVSSGNR